MYKTYKGHFNSPRRWSYVIISVIGNEHRHYIVDNIVDQNSLYRTTSKYDSRYDTYTVTGDCNSNSPFLYDVDVVTDKPGYYNVNNIVNRDSIFVIYYKGDYRK